MAPKPEKVEWIDDDTTNIVEPSGSRKASGWTAFLKPPAENFNWMWNLFSRVRDFVAGESQYNVIIDSDTDEGDYLTLVAYLADAPAAGDRVLVKVDQAITAKLTIPDDIEITFLKGVKITTATDMTTVFELSSRVTIKGSLTFELSHTGTITNAIRFNGDDSYVQNGEVKNLSTGTITSAYKIEASKDGNICRGLLSGSGTITNVINDVSTRRTNDFIVRDDKNNNIIGNLASATRNGFISATDQSKLAGIESGATGDQSDAEIKTAYENNADTNEFSDAEQSKLAGIESGAEVNNISDVNATDLTDNGETTLHSHAGQSITAWVNFDGSGVVAIRDDFNVTSITDNGVGDYTINFSSAFADTNYCLTGWCRDSDDTTNDGNISAGASDIKTVSAFQVITLNNIGGAIDSGEVNCMVIS